MRCDNDESATERDARQKHKELFSNGSGCLFKNRVKAGSLVNVEIAPVLALMMIAVSCAFGKSSNPTKSWSEGCKTNIRRCGGNGKRCCCTT